MKFQEMQPVLDCLSDHARGENKDCKKKAKVNKIKESFAPSMTKLPRVLTQSTLGGLCRTPQRKGIFPVTSCFCDHSTISKLMNKLCEITKCVVFKFFREYRTRRQRMITTNTDWTSITEDMESDSDRYGNVLWRKTKTDAERGIRKFDDFNSKYSSKTFL